MAIRMKKSFFAISDGEITAVFQERDNVESYFGKMNSQGAQESVAEYG